VALIKANSNVRMAGYVALLPAWMAVLAKRCWLYRSLGRSDQIAQKPHSRFLEGHPDGLLKYVNIRNVNICQGGIHLSVFFCANKKGAVCTPYLNLVP
jgi:hypothetical protein